MSDERRADGGGASAAIVVVLVLCGILGLLVVGGGAVFAFFRVSGTQQMEMMEARARAEMMAVQMHAALLTAHFEQGAELQVVISADKETRFDRVSKAVEAAECAGITKHRILTPSSPPVADSAGEAAAQP